MAPDAGGARAVLGRELALGLLLGLGGAAALVHETVWFRVLTPVLGAGATCAAAISAGTLLGLALGSALGGRWAARRLHPLRLLCWAEVLGALTGLALLAAAEALRRFTAGLSATEGWARDGPPALGATLLCALAATPLGVSLPAAVRWLGARAEGSAAGFRRLYAWNTLGAVLGVLFAAGFLLEALGNRGSAFVAAGLQVACGLLAWALSRRGGAPEVAGADLPLVPPDLRDAEAVPSAARLLLAAFLSGGAGLAIQVAWVRRLTPAVGTTTQAFATVLAAYLLAIALGSLLLGPRRGAGSMRGARVLLALAAVPVALLPAAIAPVARFTAAAAREFAGNPWDLLLLRAKAAGLLLLPSTILGAAALPWLLRARGAAGARGARETGRLLACNTAGSAVVALLAALFWLPAVGTAAVLRGAAGLLLLAAAAVSAGRLCPFFVLGGVALLAQPWVWPVTDEAGRDAVGASFLPDEYALAEAPALFFAEGRSTTVVVRDRDGRRELWVEGKIEASSQPTDLLHLTLLGSLPMALHPQPRVVGIVGLGTGRTAQAVAAFAPERLVVFELEAEVLRAAPLFAAEGAGLPAQARVVLGDARRSLGASSERFDVLTSDPIHPGVAGSAALYAREYYALVKQRLAPGGLLCQWLPLYQLEVDDVRLALRTFVDAFPSTHVFQAASDLLLVGTQEPLRLDEALLRARLAGPGGQPLEPLGLRSPGRLLALLVKGPRGAAVFAAEGPLNTDDRLLLEFRAGRAWFTAESLHAATLLAIGRARPETLLSAAPSAEFVAESRLGDRYREGVRAWLAGDVERSVQAFDALAGADVNDRFARAMRDEARLAGLLRWMEAGPADEELEAVRQEARDFARAPDVDDSLRLRLAAALRGLGLRDEGRALAAEVLARRDTPRARRLAGP